MVDKLLSRYKIVSLAVSTLLHGLVVWALFWDPSVAPPKESSIEITLLPPAPSVAKPTLSRGRVGRARGKPARGARQLWTPYQYFKEGTLSAHEGSSSSDDETVEIGDRRSWGAGNVAARYVDGAQTYQYIVDRLNGMTSYPRLFAKEWIEGVVNARLVWTADGHCDFERSWINGEDRWLRIYVTSRLHKLCREDFSRLVKRTRSPFIDMSFDFHLVEPQVGNLRKLFDAQIVGRSLLITRVHERTKISIPLGPIRLDPLAVMARIDFEWLFDNWDKHIKGVDPFDELEKEIQRETAEPI